MQKKLKILNAVLMVIILIIPNGIWAQNSGNVVPKLGQVISGFEVNHIEKNEALDADVISFKHRQTGAKLIYVKNSDVNKAFAIGFRTTPKDNTGVNHIIEHAVLASSEKYPSKDLFFDISHQTYNTFANAFTGLYQTFYPVASTSQKQLETMADAYLDCVFNPSFYEDPKYFEREGWRYVLDNPEAPLTVNGIVYNEMKGTSEILSSAMKNATMSLFPDSTAKYNSGGIPRDILTLDVEAFKEMHSNNYHPSNAMVTLYGDLDYKSFLDFIDRDYFSLYDKKEYGFKQDLQKPFERKIEKEFVFPVANGTPVSGAVLDKAYALSDITKEDIFGMNILASILSHTSSPLMQKLRGSGIGAEYVVINDTLLYQPVIHIVGIGADKSRRQEFDGLVEEALQEIVDKGFNQQDVEAILSSALFSQSLVGENPDRGINTMANIIYDWSVFDDPYLDLQALDYVKNIKDKIGTRYFERLIENYMLSNPHVVITATSPMPGLIEKQEKELVEALQAKKTSMSKTEIEEMVATTRDFNKWNADLSNNESIEKLQVVSVADLPEEWPQYKVSDKDIGGIRYLTTPVGIKDIGYTQLIFDGTGVAPEELHYLKLYASLLGQLSTTKYNPSQLSTLTTRYMNGLDFDVVPMERATGSEACKPLFIASWIGLKEDYNQSVNLLNDMLFDTVLSTENLRNFQQLVTSQKAMMLYTINRGPHNTAILRAGASMNEEGRMQNYLEGIAYYNFLCDIEKDLQEEPESVIEQLNAVREKGLQKKDMIAAFAGDQTMMPLFEKAVQAFEAKLAVREKEYDYASLPSPSKKDAVIGDTTMQYMAMAGAYKEGVDVTEGSMDVAVAILNDKFITPELRYKGGAYAGEMTSNEKGIIAYTYRDPNLASSRQVYLDAPSFLKQLKMSQEEIDDYIITAYAAYTVPMGEFSGALSAMEFKLRGKDRYDLYRQRMEEIKNTKVGDLQAAASVLEQVVTEEMAYSVFGSAAQIDTHKGLFDTISTIK